MQPSLDLSPAQIARYRANAIRRRQEDAAEIEQLRQEAWQAARDAAQLLKERFHATRIVVFGSLSRDVGFTRWSDVDIAAWGLAPEDTFQAIGAIMDMQTGIPVNLVDINTTQPSLKQAIEQDGLEI